MRRLLTLLPLAGLIAAVGCSRPDTPHTGPAPQPVVGKNAPKGYGPPDQGPTGPPKLPVKFAARK
jgi:hypothetical protein